MNIATATPSCLLQRQGCLVMCGCSGIAGPGYWQDDILADASAAGDQRFSAEVL